MRQITRIMIQDYNIKKLKYDFMGFTFKVDKELSFHHLIISHEKCKLLGIGEGYWKENGAILVQSTSHDYLHRIRTRDEDIFYAITSEMIDENIKGKLDLENLRYIRDMLEYFEREHCSDRTRRGEPLIKEEYIRRRIKL